jgi:hypothetical protein
VPALCGCAGHRRIETHLRRRPRADCQRAGNIRTVNITGRSPESSGTSHGNVASHTRGESSFTLPQGERIESRDRSEHTGNAFGTQCLDPRREHDPATASDAAELIVQGANAGRTLIRFTCHQTPLSPPLCHSSDTVIAVAVVENIPLRGRFWDGASGHVLDACHTQARRRGRTQGGFGSSFGEALSLHAEKTGHGYLSERSQSLICLPIGLVEASPPAPSRRRRMRPLAFQRLMVGPCAGPALHSWFGTISNP